jgi:hypothetical protein
MTVEQSLEKLHADMIRQRREIEYELKRLADAYGEKMTEWRKVSHGIIGIENELKTIKGAD